MNSSPEKSAELARFVRERYSSALREEKDTVIEGFEQFLLYSMTPRVTMHTILEEAARLIHRNFDFQYVSIAMREKADGLYRYVVSMGLTKSAEKSHKDIRYSYSDLFDGSTFPSVKISNFTHFYLGEDAPFKPGEEKTYSRPNLLTASRNAEDEMLEGDYIDVYMYGHLRDVVGFIELGGTRNGKLPEKLAIRWIELIASVIAAMVLQKESEKL